MPAHWLAIKNLLPFLLFSSSGFPVYQHADKGPDRIVAGVNCSSATEDNLRAALWSDPVNEADFHPFWPQGKAKDQYFNIALSLSQWKKHTDNLWAGQRWGPQTSSTHMSFWSPWLGLLWHSPCFSTADWRLLWIADDTDAEITGEILALHKLVRLTFQLKGKHCLQADWKRGEEEGELGREILE